MVGLWFCRHIIALTKIINFLQTMWERPRAGVAFCLVGKVGLSGILISIKLVFNSAGKLAAESSFGHKARLK